MAQAFTNTPADKWRRSLTTLIGKEFVAEVLPWTHKLRALVGLVAKKYGLPPDYLCFILMSRMSDWPSLPTDYRKGLYYLSRLALWNDAFKGCTSAALPAAEDESSVDDAIRDLGKWAGTVVKKEWLRILFKIVDDTIPKAAKMFGENLNPVDDHFTMQAYLLAEFRQGLSEGPGAFEYAPHIEQVVNHWLARS